MQPFPPLEPQARLAISFFGDARSTAGFPCLPAFDRGKLGTYRGAPRFTRPGFWPSPAGRAPPAAFVGWKEGEWYGPREGREGARAKVCRLVKCSCRSGLQFVLLPLVTRQVLAPLRQFEDPEISTRRCLPPPSACSQDPSTPIIIRCLSFPAAIIPLSLPLPRSRIPPLLYMKPYILTSNPRAPLLSRTA